MSPPLDPGKEAEEKGERSEEKVVVKLRRDMLGAAFGDPGKRREEAEEEIQRKVSENAAKMSVTP